MKICRWCNASTDNNGTLFWTKINEQLNKLIARNFSNNKKKEKKRKGVYETNYVKDKYTYVYIYIYMPLCPYYDDYQENHYVTKTIKTKHTNFSKNKKSYS